MHSSRIPKITADSTEFWAQTAEGKLTFQQCNACASIQFYSRVMCKQCLSLDLARVESTGKGRVHAFTLVHRAPSPEFRPDVPYVLALIDLDEGFRMMSNIVGASRPVVGQRVEVYFEERADAIEIPLFRPLRDEDDA